jgi:hypothetical protein
VFDYFIDNETKKFEQWTKLVQPFTLDPDLPLQVTFKFLIIIKYNEYHNWLVKIILKNLITKK